MKKNINTILVTLLLSSTYLLGSNVLVITDAYSKVNSQKVSNIINKLNSDDKLTAMVIYNDISRSKVYINNINKDSNNFDILKEKYLFRIANLDMPISKEYANVRISYKKTIQVEEEQSITFDKSDTLFAIDDSGSMTSFRSDVARDIRNVAKQINFNNSSFGLLVCPGICKKSDGFTNDKNKIDSYLDYKDLPEATHRGSELPCALKTAVDMFSTKSKNQNRLMFYFGDGVSSEDLKSVKKLKKMGVIIVPIAVGNMNNNTLQNISTSGKILKSTNINLKSLQTITRKVMVNKIIIDTKQIKIPIDNHNLFNNIVKFDLSKYDKVYLFSDMTHNADGINYQKELQEQKELNNTNANNLIHDRYGIILDDIIILQ